MELDLTLEKRLIKLFKHLGIDQAHLAARRPEDWAGLAQHHPEVIASLALICPNPGMSSDLIHKFQDRCAILTGDKGPAFENIQRFLQNLPYVQTTELSDYDPLAWSDLMVDRLDEIDTCLFPFLDRIALPPLTPPAQSSGEVAGLTYTIRGTGPPLILCPLFLAPSQWEPLIPKLSKHYTTITLGGTKIGAVALLESRGRAHGYRQMIRAMIESTSLKAGDVLLEIGCGSGAVMRAMVAQTHKQNAITGIDINAYLLAEGKALVQKENLEDLIQTQEGSAVSIPFPDNSFDITYSVTVIEEVDANAMIAEMIRVTKPKGQIAIIARAVDLPYVVNLPLEPDLKSKVEQPGGGVSPGGCADASLYTRFQNAGLTNLTTFPYLAPFDTADPYVLDFLEPGFLQDLNPEEREAWTTAKTKAKNTFFIAWPHHCAVGTKPV